MATITNYFEQAQLSMAAYAVGLLPGMFGGSEDSPYQIALTNAGMSKAQAAEFAKTYTVIDQFTDPFTGFSATVFADSSGNNYFAIRGTETGVFSGAIDWLTNVADVSAEGIAVRQGIALFNYLQRLQGAAGNAVVQYTYDPITKTVGTTTGVANGLLSGQQVSVTGHSLGGHLAMMMSRLAPGMVSSVYTYNAPGFDTDLRTNLFPLTSEGFFNLLRDAPIGPITGQIGTSWNSGIITRSDVEGDVVHDIGYSPSQDSPAFQQIIFSESANQGYFDAHDKVPLTDALAIYNLFSTIAPNIQVSTITNILEATSYTKITADTTDETLETALDALRVFVADFQQATSTATVTPTIRDNRDSFYTNFINLQTEIRNLSLYNNTSESLGLSVASLVGTDASLLFNSAKQYDSVRYALAKLNPFTITGNSALYDQINFDGSLDLYNPNTGTGSLTDQYLQNRSAFLYNKILSGNANTSTDSGDAFIAYAGAPQVFEDLNTDPGYKLYLGQDASVSNIPVDEMSRIRFGSASDNQLYGSPKWDKLYGMAGDDTLTGQGGNDYLEGGFGGDNLYGGEGNDRLLGGEGGDLLAGGADNDTLDGGQGDDTYIYNFGDGTDTILDTDGLGRIIYRDAQGIEYALDGGVRSPLSNGVYYGGNGRFVYSLDEVNHALTVSLDGLTALSIQNYDRAVETLGIVLRTDQAPEIHVTGELPEPIRMVSVAANGTQANGYNSYEPSVSADGRYVAFNGYATNLVLGDTNGTSDIFVKDMQTGAVILASTTADGTQANGVNNGASISDDGRYVAFASYATNLVAGDTNNTWDVFVKDLQSGALIHANTAADGTQANGWTSIPSISADGRYVTFASAATNLVPEDTDNTPDIFIKDLQTGTITRANTTADWTEAKIYADGRVSADGRYVVFVSTPTDPITGAATGGPVDIFVKDLQTGVLTRVGPSADESIPTISGDGRYVAFSSDASNLVAGDTNGIADIFVRDLQTGAVARVNTAADGSQANEYTDTYTSAITADGRYIVFASIASNLVTGDTLDTYDAFIAPNPLYQSIQVTTDANTPVVINNVTVTDADAGSAMLSVTLSVDHGSLALQNTTGLTFTDADGSDGTLAFSGTLSDLNAALAAGIIYAPTAAYVGDDALSLTVDDQFPGGGLTDNATLALKVLPPPVILGTAGNDTLTGTNGNDTFNGGAGNDTLVGGAGNDTYVFNLGDGIDTIVDSTVGGDTNIVSFGVGVDPNSISLGLGSLLVRYGDLGDAIHIENFDPNNAFNPLSISEFHFTDGTILSYADLISRGFDLIGTDSDDVIIGTNATDRITGGKGNDILNAGAGNDAYIYNLGDGLDTLTDASGNDTVQFGTGFSFDNTVIRTSGGIARLRFLDADGCEGTEGMDITLNVDGTSPIETFAFPDGVTYSLIDLAIQQVTWYGTHKADTIITGRHDDTIYAGKGGDTVYAGTGHDILYGENGKDRLYGDGGNDSLYGGKGNDYLDGGCGNDLLDGGKGHNTLVGGEGNDTLVLGHDSENTILFNAGDGWDTLKTSTKDEGHDNEIKFGEGIIPDKLWFERAANDLRISILGTHDGMTIEGWYSNKHRPIEEIKTANGYELEDKKIQLLVQAMAAFSPIPGSGNPLPTEMPESLQPVLAAAWEVGH